MIHSNLSNKTIHMIATGSGQISELVKNAEQVLTTQLFTYQPFVPYVTTHPLYVADYNERLDYLQTALMNPEPTIMWALRGGSGTINLLPALKSIKPTTHHWIVGFSDVTALHLLACKFWDWVTIHGPTLNYFDKDLPHAYWQPTLNLLKNSFLDTHVTNLIPLNNAAKVPHTVTGLTIGGNMSLIQSSIGTFWQVDCDKKILFLEDVNEAPYRVAERLIHFQQAGILRGVQAILFGDFTMTTTTPDHQDLIDFVLKSFAEKIDIPVFCNLPIGHYDRNIPILNNYSAQVICGKSGEFIQVLSEKPLSVV